MIAQSVIDKINSSVSIVDVVARYVTLKPAGRTQMGCCPFHNEKTASFHVNDSQGFYKCFGCGAGGDTIAFLQGIEKMSFEEAVEYLADDLHISVEYDRHYTPAEFEVIKCRKKDIETTLAIAHKYYHNQLMSAPDDAFIWQYLNKRGINKETALDWQMGWAPDGYNNISNTIIEKGLHTIAVDLGLIGVKNAKTYDKYRNRLIIPSHNKNGQLNGFVGRNLGNDDSAKYINPADSEVYNKSTELFGLAKAAPHIREEGFVFLVEGNLDVVMMHQADVSNTVCAGGTSLTLEHIKILKRYTDTICIITDGDSAGHKAAMKWIDMCLNLDVKVQIIELPWGQDPDSYIRTLQTQYYENNVEQ